MNASYSGLTINEFKNVKQMDYIVVFDWEGNIKRVYKVEGGLKALAADEAEGADAIGVIKM